MLFNSIEFFLFIVTVFFLYWFVFGRNVRLQNLFLVAASYLFYGWWDWRFLSLILLSSCVDFVIGKLLSTRISVHWRKWLLIISLVTNIGILGIFKYFNFFIQSFETLLEMIGFQANISTLKLILPVGISFYTFQTLSYTIDVYRGKTNATKDPVSFFAFVSFFPQLVAGPIERATSLLNQFRLKRIFTYQDAVVGLRLMLWGFFKKLVIADNCAVIVNEIFRNYEHQSGALLFAGAILFSFQIYGDFSGYSDIARGTAKLFGFNLMVNFRTPYFSRDIAEFWRRWHISLSTWFRDYIYIPLGGSRVSKWLSVRNVFIIFIISGLWHGANWTFAIWGLIHALLFLPLLLRSKNRKFTNIVAEEKLLPNFGEISRMLATFLFVSLAWVFFRADSVEIAGDYLYHMISSLSFFGLNEILFSKITLLLVIFILAEWLMRKSEYLFQLYTFNRIVRWSSYLAIGTCIILFAPKEANEFIYFQF